MNTHEQINKLLAGYVLRELSPQQLPGVEAHLAECRHCSGEVKRLEALLECTGQMGKLSVDEQMCESAKEALFAAIASEEKEPTPRLKVGLESIWRTIMKSRTTKLAAAAAIIIAVFWGLGSIGGPDLAKTAWGEVSRRFAQVDYVHVYWFKSRDDVLFGQFEAWYAHGKLVMRGKKGGMTYDDGQTQQSFDEQGRRTAQQLSFLAEGKTFLEVFTAGLLSDKNVQFNQETPTNVGDDFLIYEFDPPADMDDSKWLEGISVTVGKNSLLPVQMKIYEKDSDDYDLVMFDYEAPEKPAEFFDPPAVEPPHGIGEVMLDGEEAVIDIEGAPGLRQAIVRLYSKYDGPSEKFPSDYMHSDRHEREFCRAVSETRRKEYKKKGGPIFRLDVSFVTDEGYRSNTNDLLALWLNEAQQCGVGKDWPDGKYRNIRFSPVLKPTEREDTYVVEMRCWLRTKEN